MTAVSKSLAVFLMAGLLCAAGAVVPGDAESKIILKVATQSSRPGTPRADYIVHFQKGVAERTQGENRGPDLLGQLAGARQGGPGSGAVGHVGHG